ncbi:MAG: von Willebrand factor type domain protein [Acidobacteria bacterium]|nr:von Willebrand factor type domain protein [Acidobacteriota bacterium]
MRSRAANMAIMQTRQTKPGCSCSRIKSVLLATVLLLISVTPCLAQVPESADTLRIDSDLVSLQVSVLSHDPLKPPTYLQQSDFKVLDDGSPQEITFFAAADAPFDLVLLLDLSGSTADKLKLIRKSSKRFVEASRPLDRIAIITFTDDIEIVSPLTSNHKELFRAIDDIERPSGGTSFWDALRYVYLAVLRPGQSSRRTAVVVMTDGVDNALPDVGGAGSRITFEELANIAAHSEAVVFPVFLDTEKEEVKRHRTPASAYVLARAQLAQLAEASGTVVRRANKVSDLESVYEQIIRDLGTVYSIGYRPVNNKRDGKWHQISVALLEHPDLTARTRNGYYSGSLASSSPP